MAKITSTFGPMSGKVGGVVFSRNRYGTYLRLKVIPVNPGTLYQTAQRNYQADVAGEWQALTTEQRQAWDAYAANTPILGRNGQPLTLSGQAMFIRCQRWLDSDANGSHTTDAPVVGAMAPNISAAVFSYGAGPPKTLSVALTISTYPCGVAVYAAAARAASRQWVPRLTWLKGSGNMNLPVSIDGLYAAYMARHGLWTTGGLIRFGFVAVNHDATNFQCPVPGAMFQVDYTIP